MNTRAIRAGERLMRHAVYLACCASLLMGPAAYALLQTTGDHLVPVAISEADSAYWRVVNKQLLVTRGDLARCIWLPGNVGTEGAVSLYRHPRSKGDRKGRYRMTVTQASKPIWESLGKGAGSTPQQINIRRFDVSVPETMALAIAKLWRTMLKRTSTAPSNQSLSLDESTEVFSATVAGHEVVGSLNKNPANKNSLEFLDIANSLLEYFNYSTSQQPKRAEQLRHQALALVDRIEAQD